MISIALLGFGNIGGGTAQVLTENRAQIEKFIGRPINIKYILDRRDFSGSPFEKLIVRDFNIILNDPEVKIVAEMLGGYHPAYEFTKACLEAGKHVVTPNKAVVAKFGAELHDIAAAHGVRYMFEASVGGGIPIIRPIMNDLAANGIISISGILNGTTNYILTRMEDEGVAYSDVLKDAQKLGYAEADPTDDVEGYDAARKIVILSALAFGGIADADSIHCEGITKITSDDIKTASSHGCAVKLIAHTEKVGGKLLAMVTPRFVRRSNPLFGVRDVFNGIIVEGDMIGKAMFYGAGAGRLPTASAVVADIADIAANIDRSPRTLHWNVLNNDALADFSDYSCQRCFIFADEDGCEARLSAVFGAKSFVRENGRVSFISEALTERDAQKKAAECGATFIKSFRML